MDYRRTSNALQSTVIYLQRESKIPPAVFCHFFPNVWEFLIIFYTLITRYYLC